MFDLVIAGGSIVDGTGAPPFRGDVAIVGDRIQAIGRLAGLPAARTLDATGLLVAPGFIDAHVHGDLALLADPMQEAALRQGVTTYILGQDGSAFAPGSAETVRYMRRYTAGFNGLYPEVSTPGGSVADYLARFQGTTALNVAYLVPNGNIRLEVMGLDPGPASPSQIRAMQRLVETALDQGAVGLSSGLDYIPSRYADTQELTALCQPLTSASAVYVTHMRGYGRLAPGAMREVGEIARGSGAAMHVSHYNGGADILLPLVETALAEGIDLTYDTYPYLAGSTILGMVALPVWIQDGGIDATLDRLRAPEHRRRLETEWFHQPLTHPVEGITLSMVPNRDWRWAEGLPLQQAAERSERSLCNFVCDLLVDCDMAVGVVAHRGSDRTEDDVAAILRHPAHMAGSDGIFSGGHPHPRGWGAFARYLGRHTRELGHYSWGEAAVHLAWHAARRYRLTDRGLVRVGCFADLAVFDPATISDRSTYENGRAYAVGMRHVIVNGVLTLADGGLTRATPGRAITRG